jgi:NAD+ synthase (glutamine-hydrolysing)
MTAYDCLKLYVDGELSKKVNFDVEYLFPDVESFINDLEKWWTLHDGMSYYKRIQAPPILSVSKRAYGFDLRETQKKAFYSHRYQELKNKVLNKE